MTAALASLLEAGSINALQAVHVNHGIRPQEECAADEAASRALCDSLHVSLAVAAVPRGAVAAYAREKHSGLEAAARCFRHKALRKEQRRLGAGWVLALAHSRDDVLENVLMAVLRGAGPSGLGAMRRGGRLLARPVIDLGRTEICAYLAERGIPFSTDASNADTRFLRNRVRAVLVPLLDREFPHWRKPLLRLWETQGLLSDALVPAGLNDETPLFRAEEALFRACNSLVDGGRLKRDTARRFLRGEKAADLGSGLRLERKKGMIVVSQAGRGETAGFSVLIKKPGVYKLTGCTIAAKQNDDASWTIAVYGADSDRIQRQEQF
jgi:tRNA(Ile)-lysidine synthase